MPKYLQKRRRVWYAMLNIPAALRPTFGRRTFLKSLETEALSVAEVRVLSVVAEWKKQIAIARATEGGTDDELLATVMKVRQDAQRLKGEGTSDDLIQMIHEDVGYGRRWDEERGDFVTDDETLANAVSIVHGTSLLLREHIEDYLASRDVTAKTTDMQRRDLKLFAQAFEFAKNATRPKILGWVNVELTTSQSLSVATVSRMISACRGYWDYLERHKGLTLEPPFNKVLPSKSRRKTKTAMESEGRAFRVADYHKLMASCEHPALTDLIHLGAYTGCRIEELCSLKLENVLADRLQIENAKSQAGWRTTPIHKDIAQTVARLVNTSDDGYLLSGLTFNKYGGRSNAIGKRFGRLKKALDYSENYVFHSLRKGFATQLENANIPLNVSARLMGHEIQNETFGRYSDGLALDVLLQAISHVSWK
jgi:integrase